MGGLWRCLAELLAWEEDLDDEKRAAIASVAHALIAAEKAWYGEGARRVELYAKAEVLDRISEWDL